MADRKVSENVFLCFLSQQFSILMPVAIDLILIFQSSGNIRFFLSEFEGNTSAELTCPFKHDYTV